MKSFFMTIAFAAACLLGVGIGRFSYSEELAQELPPPVVATAEEPAPTKMQKSQAFSIDAVLPSVVCVSARSSGEDTDSMPTGSGIILSEDGYILTHRRLVANGKVPITVTLSDQSAYTAHLMWEDAATELAIIKIRANGLTPAPLSKAPTLALGATVTIVGAFSMPFARACSGGSISTESHTVTEKTADGTPMYRELFLADAALCADSLGAPLFNHEGTLIGICTTAPSTTPHTPAIPIAVCLPVIEAFLKTDTFHSIDFGITCHNHALTAYLTDEKEGMQIIAIQKNSPAEKAGLQKNDILLSVNDHAPTTLTALRSLNFATPVGTLCSITYKRDGITYRTELKLSLAED